MKRTCFALAFAGALSFFAPRSNANTAEVVELACIHREGMGASFENEVDRITLNLSSEEVRLWASARDDGWLFRTGYYFYFNERASLTRDPSDGVINGTGHNYFVTSIFRYSPKESRFQYIYVVGSGRVYQIEYRCKDLR